MEASGRDGGRGPCLHRSSYRGKQIGSNPYDNSISSSSSGTIVSTTYTSGGSRLSSTSMDAVRHVHQLALDEDTECVQLFNKSRKDKAELERLVKGFFGAPSAELSISISSNNGGDMSVLERWFSELDVAWVLHLPDGDDAYAELHHTSADAAERWIRGLHRIMGATNFCEQEDEPVSEIDMGATNFCEQEGQPVAESDKQANNVPDQIHFARFIKEVVSKMLPFVDFAIRQVVVVYINVMPPAPYKKLHTLLAVHEALSDATYKILTSTFWPLSASTSAAGVYWILLETSNLLSAKRDEVGEVIWSTMERIRTLVRESMDIEYGHDSSSSVIPQASSDIHTATLSVKEYIGFLCSNSSSMRQIIESQANRLGKYGPRRRPQCDLISPPAPTETMDIMSRLEEKLVKISESFPHQGLRFLFLLNNLEFIRQSLGDTNFSYCWCWPLTDEQGKDLSEKIEGYMESYLQACWETVLSCLISPTPLCFGINHSPLLKFESEFNKTYNTNKFWKVPDPNLRKRLRTAIINKIVPRYTEYIFENNITTQGVAPQDLEKMLQELFEG